MLMLPRLFQSYFIETGGNPGGNVRFFLFISQFPILIIMIVFDVIDELNYVICCILSL